jgi:hypothetical protein
MKVVCTTCDGYSYIIPWFVHYLHKTWPQCPWPLTVVTNDKPIDTKEEVFFSGSTRTFADILGKYIDQEMQHEPIFLHLQEDYIVNYVDHDVIMLAYSMMMENRDIAFIRLCPYPPPTIKLDAAGIFGEQERATPYIISAQATLWRTDFIRTCLVPGESGWDFEIHGYDRVKISPANLRFLSVWKPAITYHNLMNKQREDPRVVKWIQENW